VHVRTEHDHGLRPFHSTESGRPADMALEVILQACRRSSVLPAAAVGRLFLQTARSCARTPAGALPAIRSSGAESDFSPDTVRSTLARTATSASHSSHAASSPQDGVRGSRGAARRAAWAVAIARRLSSPKLLLTSEAGVCSQPGWPPAHRPDGQSGWRRSRPTLPHNQHSRFASRSRDCDISASGK
jgi:hypothetical protein